MKSKKPVDQKAAAKRAALNALRRARNLVARTGASLSEWEDEFLGSVEERVDKYGRAFGDPEKGAAGQALSALQTIKLREIAKKARASKEETAEEIVAVVEGGEDEEPPPTSPPKRSHRPRRGF